jgi:2-polyprenyl-3-methyl-5-hydroxy-6-metoxy-1,4-benzoquinol methylase
MSKNINICPACGNLNNSNENIILSSSRGEDKNWCRCKNCKAYFYTEQFDNTIEVQHGSNTSYGEEKSGINLGVYKQYLYSTILNLLIENGGKKDLKVLDVGCSYGGLLKFLKNKNFSDIYGIDILPQPIQYLKSEGYNVENYSSVDQLENNMLFDVVTVIDTNYYWPNQQKEIEAIRNHLKNNGLLIMRVTDKSWLVSAGIFIKKIALNLGIKIIARGLNDHRFSMPVKSLLKLLKDEGFSMEKINISGAYYSNSSTLAVKLSFIFGDIIYRISGLFIAPGAVIVAKKNI